MIFGNGVPWETYASDARLTLEGVRSLAAWFLLLRPRGSASPGAPTQRAVEVTSDPDAIEDPTCSAVALPRTKTGGSVGADPMSSELVFRVQRKPRAQFDFVSIGRNENNDLFLPDPSVSRFHAFLRETPGGGLLIQDVRSANGTRCRGQRVPAQGEGPAVVVVSGDAVRFGDIGGVALNAVDLFEKARAHRGR